jgi:hypothetical protein
MKGNSLWQAVVAIAVLMLAVVTGVFAEPQSPRHFSGVINDYTPISGTTAWEVRGPWTLKLNGESGRADFSAAVTMELSPVGQSAANISAATLTQHTHDITMKDATVYFETVETTECPELFKPPTSGEVIRVTGQALVTGNGQAKTPFAPNGETSQLTVCISGGAEVPYANITLQFGLPASSHLGSQAINGVVRKPKQSGDDAQ